MAARKIATALVVTLGLAACASSGEETQFLNQALLAGAGAVVGGYGGSSWGSGGGQLIMIGMGAYAGAWGLLSMAADLRQCNTAWWRC